MAMAGSLMRPTIHVMSADHAPTRDRVPSPPSTATAAVGGLTIADVMHTGTESLPLDVTVGALREWFAISASRRLAVIADEGRYAASLTPPDITADAAGDRPAVEMAWDRPSIAPDTTAATGRDVVFATAARRVPVVDAEGRLHGVLAVTGDLQFFACRPATDQQPRRARGDGATR
jgi:hypothetical protein